MKPWQWLLVAGVIALALAGGAVIPTIPPIVWPDVVKRFASAIAYAEGFGKPGTIPTVRNNPGDLTDSTTGAIISYDTPDDGWSALYHQVYLMFYGGSAHYNASMSILQIGQIYAADWVNWVNNVSSYLGVSADTKLSELA